MASLKNMMNVQVKLEPLPQSILQQAHGTINLAHGAGPPLLQQPKPAESRKRSRKRPAEDPPPSVPIKVEPKVEKKPEPILTIPSIPNIPNIPSIPSIPNIPNIPSNIPSNIPASMPVKKKRDRFNGMTEEEVLQRKLPDHLTFGLDIAIVGINPGLTAAYVGHHYAGPGNHFWKCLFLSGLIPTPMKAYDDFKLKEHGIGFTNMVERTSRGSADLSRKEIQEGGKILKEKIKKYKPRIAVFNGKGIFEVFCGHKKFSFGKQPVHFPDCEDTLMFVMPSSSARCTQLPRAVDKVPFYAALRKLRDHLRGDLENLDDSEVTFPDLELKTAVKSEAKKEAEARNASKKARKQQPPQPELSSAHQSMIQQVAQQVKMEDGFMPPPMNSGGAMGGMYMPPPPQHTQQPPPQPAQQQAASSSAAAAVGRHPNPIYGMGNSSWGANSMMGGPQPKPEPGMGPQHHQQQQPPPGPGAQFYPQWSRTPQPAHSHVPSGGPQQQPPPAMNPSPAAPWSSGMAAHSAGGGGPWMQPHQQYMKSQAPPPYPYPGQYGGGPGGPGPQGQSFPFPNTGFPPHLMPQQQQKPNDHNRGFSSVPQRDQGPGMYDKVKEEPRWT